MPTRLTLSALVLCLCACGDDEDAPPTAPGETVLRPAGELQPWDLAAVVPIDSVRAMPAGTPLFMRTEFANGELADLEMTFVQVVDDFLPPMPVIMVEASDPVLIQLGGIARGMSGSPVFSEQGTWGAIAYGFIAQDSPPFYFFATPVEWVTGSRGMMPAAKSAATWEGARVAPLEIPLLSTGLDFMQSRPEWGSSPLGETVSAGITRQRQESFEAGRPLAVGLLLGELTLGALGTVSYVEGDRIYGFGHSFFGAGEVRFPIIESRVLGEISNLFAPFKFATLNPSVRGTLTEDRLPAVRGLLGEEPELVPVTSVYEFPSGSAVELTHRAAAAGLDPFVSIDLVANAFFSPLAGRVDGDPGHSIRVVADAAFSGTDSTLARSRLYASPEGRLSSLIFDAHSDLSFVLSQLMTRNDYALQLREAGVRVEVIPEPRFAEVAQVTADTVVSAGSTLEVGVSLRVGRRSDREVGLAIVLPDTLPAGVYRLEVGSAATLAEGPGGGDGPFSGLDNGPLSGVFGPPVDFAGEETLDEVFARVNGPDRNVILKARLTFEMPSWEDGPGDSPADTGSDFGLVPDFGGLFSFGGSPATVSAEKEVDLFLAGSRTLRIEVTGD